MSTMRSLDQTFTACGVQSKPLAYSQRVVPWTDARVSSFTNIVISKLKAVSSPTRLLVALEARKKTLKEDPDAAVVEPHRIRCAVCKTWVKLRQDCAYSIGKWVKHRRRWPHVQPSQTEVQYVALIDVHFFVADLIICSQRNSMEANEADNESDDPDDDQEAMDVEDVLKGEANHTNEGDVAKNKALIEANATDNVER